MNSPSASGVYSYVPGKPILLRFVPGEGISLYRAPYKLYGSFKKCVSVTKKFNIVIHDSWVHLRGRCWDSWLVEYADRWFRECGHLCVPHLTRGYRRRCRPLEQALCFVDAKGSSGLLPHLVHPAFGVVGLADLLREVPRRHQEMPEVRSPGIFLISLATEMVHSLPYYRMFRLKVH